MSTLPRKFFRYATRPTAVAIGTFWHKCRPLRGVLPDFPARRLYRPLIKQVYLHPLAVCSELCRTRLDGIIFNFVHSFDGNVRGDDGGEVLQRRTQRIVQPRHDQKIHEERKNGIRHDDFRYFVYLLYVFFIKFRFESVKSLKIAKKYLRKCT